MGISERVPTLQSGNLIGLLTTYSNLLNLLTMCRGVVSKSVRAQNRAELAGNPNRGNPHAGSVKKHAIKRRLKENHIFHKIIVHDNKTYRVGYDVGEDGVVFIQGIVRYTNPLDTNSYFVITEERERHLISMKLVITLSVEEAKKGQ